MLVKIPRISGIPGFQVGQELVVGWKAKDCRILEV
ncbi:hypothetical protein NKH82_32275 [Mesorhizobium sp. M0915]